MIKRTWLAVFGFASLHVPTVGAAETDASKSAVAFSTTTLLEPDTKVQGELSLPEGAGKLPAVVIIHNAGGLQDRTGSDYVEALNKIGIATLELNLFTRGGAPASARGHVPHTYGSLIFLAEHPRIDASRIGVMGFSYGAVLSMATVSDELTRSYTGGKHKFAAHLPLYFPCWTGNAVMEGRIKSFNQTIWQTTTGAPVHLLAGDKDDYGAPDMCPRFVSALPDAANKHVAVTVYPDAYHGWDTHEDRTYQDRLAFGGRGGTVRHFRNPAIAEKSRAFAVNFFKTAFEVK